MIDVVSVYALQKKDCFILGINGTLLPQNNRWYISKLCKIYMCRKRITKSTCEYC